MPRDYAYCKGIIRHFAQTKKPKDWRMDSNYSLSVTVYTARDRVGDVDQLIGTIMDAGEGVFWQNDRLISEATIVRAKATSDHPVGSQCRIVDLLAV